MTPHAKQRFLAHANRLIDEGNAVLKTEVQDRTWRLGDGVPTPPYVELAAITKWLVGCQNLVVQLGDEARAWESSFQGPTTGFAPSSIARCAFGKLVALRESLEHDALSPVEALIFADAFGSLLEQADELHGKGYVLAAGVLGRAVLEEHLRKMCDRHNCPPAGRPTINDLNQSLYKGQHIDKLAMQGVTAMATAGNHCAHNVQPPLSGQDVQKFLDDLRAFLIRHPLT